MMISASGDSSVLFRFRAKLNIMKLRNITIRFCWIAIGILFGPCQWADAQVARRDTADVIQFSGLVLTEELGKLVPVPYANVIVKDKRRGDYTNLKGYFSLAVEKGDVILFSCVGFKTASFVIPDTLTDDRYSLVQLLPQDTIMLAETVIFPWPSREHFRQEFLAMDVTNELEENAKENLDPERLAAISEVTPSDGNESGDYYMRNQAKSYYYYGQTPPMNIFNPLAWKKFFDAWKSGEFKKKK